jgi:hypothetical protein
MLQTYTRSNNGTAVASSTPINFLTNKIKRNCSVQHSEGSPSIVLHGAGIYKVEFNGIFTAPSTTATTINVQMLADTVVVPEALAVATSASTTDYVNLAFTTLVRVKPSCCAVDNTTTLTFLNTNADILFNANVVITKVC